jgi:hypothetical protein
MGNVEKGTRQTTEMQIETSIKIHLKNTVQKVRTGFIWLRIKPVAISCVNGSTNMGFKKGK